MSFMDKLKSAVNTLTGGGAKVSVIPENPTREGAFKVKVKAVIGEQDLSVNRVYIQLNGFEQVVVHNVAHEKYTSDERETANTYDHEIVVAEAQTLKAKQEYEWSCTVEFPRDVLPTYHGRNATHELRILAGLDTKGNDPDSGWMVLGI